MRLGAPNRIELSAIDTLGAFINSIRQAGGRDSLPWRNAGGYCTRKITGSEARSGGARMCR